MNRSESIVKIAPALAKAYTNIGVAAKGGENPHYDSAFATLGDVMKVCKQPLLEQGISVLQLVGYDPEGGFLETILLHESGEYIGEKMRLKESKPNDPQAQGSAISYARRYALQSACFIPAVDDDAEGATERPAAPAAQPKLTQSFKPQPTRQPAKAHQPADQDGDNIDF